MRARLLGVCTLVVLLSAALSAQEPDTATRQTIAADAQAEKAKDLQPYVPTTVERGITRLQDILQYQTITWHPFFRTAAQGGGFPFGAGYMLHPSPYNSIDVRGSYSSAGYKLAEVEFLSPRLFKRRASLSVVGGWGEATALNFYGFGPDTSLQDHTNYGFRQGYGTALLTVRPQRFITLRGGGGLARWSPADATGPAPDVENVYTPLTLPGLNATVTYVHLQGTVGFDWRPAPGYARRGGFYGVTAHDYRDRDDRFGFQQLDYEVIQHIPILREAWVLSLRGLAETTIRRSGQEVPYFLLPHLGGGSTLRGFESWRFRDRDKLLMQAEWRIMVNRYLDTAVFYDAGKVAAHKDELDFDGLKHDYGFGARFHTPFQTALRVEVARSVEGTRLIFSTSSGF